MANAKTNSIRRGYPVKWLPEHPKARNGCVSVHILIAEQALGRLLPNGVEVHHVDEDRTNYANRNLVICQDKAYHRLLHVRSRVIHAGGDPDTERICATCRALKLFAEFNRSAADKNTGLQQQCRQCSRETFRKWRERQQSVSRA